MINEEIIIRYITGETTEKENLLISSWLSESSENQKILEQFYFTWKTADCIHIIESANPQQKLSSLKDRIKNKNQKRNKQKVVLWIQRIAAILFLPTLLLSYYFYNSGKENTEQYMEVRTNPGMITSIILPDSSKVWINSCGYLKYPIRFTKTHREVFLEGEGYFEVKKNEAAPFTVKVNDNYAVQVLGTSFNITAYKEDERIETTLVEGSVRLNIKTQTGESISQLLKPDQKAIFEKNRLALQQVDPIIETSWKDGKMYFKNQPMNDVIKRLSRHYNVVFDVKNPEILESLITAKFESEQLLQVLEYIKLASDIKYKIHRPNITDDRLNETTIELTK